MFAAAVSGMLQTGLMGSWSSFICLAIGMLRCSFLQRGHSRRQTYFHWENRSWFPAWPDQLFLAWVVPICGGRISASAAIFACELYYYGNRPDCSFFCEILTMGPDVYENGCDCGCALSSDGSFTVLLFAVTSLNLKIFACQIFYGYVRRCGIDLVRDLRIKWVRRLVLCWGCFLGNSPIFR